MSGRVAVANSPFPMWAGNARARARIRVRVSLFCYADV